MIVVLVETGTLTVNRKRETKSPVFTSNVLLMQPSTRGCSFLGVQSPQKERGLWQRGRRCWPGHYMGQGEVPGCSASLNIPLKDRLRQARVGSPYSRVV